MRAFLRLSAAAAAFALLGAAPRGAAAQAADTAEPAATQHSPVFSQMRQEALTTPPEELQFEGRRPRVWGSVMELGLPTGRVATLVVFADGTTSLYSSAGGGIVGSGSQRTVRRASDEFLEEAAEANRGMADAAESPLPSPGRVRFYLRTNAGLRTAEAGEDELKAGGHALSELYTAGQAVLAQVRPLSSQGGATTP
ncbi:MAG TPA: hypothetical protein VLK84_09665 [Longimicrobium sp.]|nr:hypothetical protein [Longimicrobium sp.]